jgi:hypothetical protein
MDSSGRDGPTVESMPSTLPTVTAVCCREWEVFLFVKMGRCGYCGEIPEIRIREVYLDTREP